MKIFGRTGGYWLFWISAAYVVAGVIDIFWLHFIRLEFLQGLYALGISLPLWIPPLARFFHMKCIWEV